MSKAPKESLDSSLKNNVYSESRQAGHKVDPRLQVMFVLTIGCFIVAAIGFVVPQHIFDESLHHSGTSTDYTFAWFLRDLQTNVGRLFGFFVDDEASSVSVANVASTYMVIMMAGAGLALCGALYQTTFRNALITPSTLGVMSGAVLGMGMWVVFVYDEEGGSSGGSWLQVFQSTDTEKSAIQALWNSYSLSICTFVGCLVVVGLVLLTLRVAGKGGRSPIMMIVVGQVIGAIMGAVMQTIRYYYVEIDPEGVQAAMLKELQISSFYRSYGPLDIAMVAIPLVIMFGLVMLYRRKLMVLSFTEAEARSMGIETRNLRIMVIALATLLTAIIVSFCGRVGFVGFIVPHLARRLVGSNLGYLLPAAMLLGALFVLTAFVLVNIFLASVFSSMAGMFISIFGAIVFLVTALRGKGVRDGS